MKPLTVVTFCHRQGGRPIYRPWHVVNMRAQFAKHLKVPHRFVCVTDDCAAMEAAGIEAFPLWAAPPVKATVRHWLFNYNRLALFDADVGGLIGERLLNVDLDAIIRANIDDIVMDPAPFKIMSLQSRVQLQGGLFLIEPGSQSVNPWAAIHDDPTLIERARRWVGSDQAVLSELFYGNVPTWDEEDGLIINQFDWPGWRMFWRTGARKCWDAHAPEREVYYRESGRSLDEPAPYLPHQAMSGRTPGGLSTRVRRYIVRR